jgi:hypothetical protein
MARQHGFRLMAKYGVVNWPIVAFSASRRYPLPRDHGRIWKRIWGIPLERDFKFPDFMQLWAIRLKRIRDEIDRVPSGDVIELRYEDIQSNAKQVMCQIADFGEFRCGAGWLDAVAAIIRCSGESYALHRTIRPKSSIGPTGYA